MAETDLLHCHTGSVTHDLREAHFKLASDGDYDVVLSLAGDSAMNIRPKFKLKMDDKDVRKERSL